VEQFLSTTGSMEGDGSEKKNSTIRVGESGIGHLVATKLLGYRELRDFLSRDLGGGRKRVNSLGHLIEAACQLAKQASYGKNTGHLS